MALELRSNCEWCDKDLPPAATDALICSYECTFCADCVERHLANVCPNCGGVFTAWPIRPETEWRPGLSVAKRPPSAKRVYLFYEPEEIARFSACVRDIPPSGAEPRLVARDCQGARLARRCRGSLRKNRRG